MEVLTRIIKVLSTTIGRDRVCKLVQYLAMYWQFSKAHGVPKISLDVLENSEQPLNKLHYNMWLTRKLLRIGLLWKYVQDILKFINEEEVKEEKGSSKKKKNMNKNKEKEVKDKHSFSIFEFDVPALKALATISKALFCLSDFPFLLKEMNVLNRDNYWFNQIYALKHIFWILVCLFKFGNQYILIKAVNLKMERFKKMSFPDEKANKDALKQFDGKQIFWCKKFY